MSSPSKIAYGKDYYQKNKAVIAARSKKRYRDNKESILKQHKLSYAKRDIRELLVERAKARAKKKNIPFNITKEDIILPEFCPVLGYRLIRNFGKDTSKYNSYSIDKIIPELGYVKNNIQIISYKANSMKLDATKEELKSFAKWVLTK